MCLGSRSEEVVLWCESVLMGLGGSLDLVSVGLGSRVEWTGSGDSVSVGLSVSLLLT